MGAIIGKITGNKIILGAVAGVFIAIILVVVMLVMGGGKSSTTAAAAGAKPAATAKAKSEATGRFGPTWLIKDQIVNLADPGGRRYLRFTIALEFGDPAAAVPHARQSGNGSSFELVAYEPGDSRDQPMTEGSAPNPQKLFEERVKKYAPAMQDIVTTVLSSKTYAEIASAEGKELVKREIKDRIQRLLGDAETLTNVYFTEFVVQ